MAEQASVKYNTTAVTMDSDLLKTNMICTMVVVLKFWWSLTVRYTGRWRT